jgi:CheY-like chemotaxis protein
VIAWCVAAPVRVLVVDDQPDTAEMMCTLLEGWGFECRFASTGRNALALAAAFDPDVFLLDLGLPDISGYEVAQELRRGPRGKDLYLIAVSGWAREEDRKRALEAGFDVHLGKPVTPTAIRAIVNAASAVTR